MKNYLNFELDIKDLIFSCNNMEPCADETNSCDALEDVLQSIIQESWDVSPESPSKGYELIIWSNTEELVRLTEGNITNTYKGSSQDFVKRGSSIDIVFQVYS